MNPAARLVVSLIVRLILIFYAGWFAIAESALPPETSVVSRVGLALLCLILSIFVGELSTLRMHVGMVLGALRKVSGGERLVPETVAAEVGAGLGTLPRPGDAREAVDILIATLGAESAETRQTALAQLKRLTGQDLPADAGAWGAWWSEHREEFEPPAS